MSDKSAAFKRYYQQLNPPQKKAVDTVEGVVMVIAGPGTGKTQVLTLRIANILLKTHARPDNILALTFTESGVAAMRERLLEIIGPAAYQVNIHTFHGFSNILIRSNPQDFPALVSAETITELQQIEIAEKIFANTRLKYIKPVGDPTVYIKPALSAIQELKRENITPEDFESILDEMDKEFDQIPDLYHEKGRWEGKMKGKYKDREKEMQKNRELLEVYRRYQQALRKQHLYDYEDMLLYVVQKLQSDDDFKMKLQEQYQYFLLDEHQDTNRAQNRIVELLADYHPNPNVFAVGDEKQAIFRFQGASLANFLYLKQLYPEAKLISLTHNYRSTQTILDATHQVIRQNELPEDIDLPLRVKLKAHRDSLENAIRIVDLPDFFSEYHYVAKDLQKTIDDGVSPDQIAVLGRNNLDLHHMAQVLAQHQVPFVLEAKQNILADPAVQAVLIILRAVTHLDSDEHLVRAMHLKECAIHPRDIIMLTQSAKERKVSVWSTMDHLENIKSDLLKPKAIDDVYQKLVAWHTAAQNDPLDQVFTQILKGSGVLESVLSQPEFMEKMDKLITLYQQVKTKLHQNPQTKLAQFIEFIELLESHGLTIETGVSTSHKQAVRLMTAHGSKGLEFDRVYILNCYDKKWGNNRNYGARFKLPYEKMQTSIQDPDEADNNADERRLFYVALTRAREQVIISYATTGVEGSDKLPSQFLAELPDELIHQPETQTFESWFTQNKHRLLAPESMPTKRTAKHRKELKQLIRQLFAQKGLSVSALNNYLECPWRYFFRNLVLLPEAKTNALIFGSAVHHTFHRFHSERQKEEVGLDRVLEIYRDHLETQPLSSVEFKEMKEKGREVLTKYYQEKMLTWPKDAISEQWIAGVGLDPDIKLTGKLDMMVPLSKPHEVEVHDFKTGKPKSRNYIEGNTKNATSDYKRQLVFYQLLLNRFQLGKYTMKAGVIDFIQPNQSDKLKSERFVITADETKELAATIKQVAEEIRDLSFWERRCDDLDCEYCRLRELMG